MGDRTNVVFSDHKPRNETISAVLEGNIVLYSHWGGSEMPSVLQDALRKATPRWDDRPYAARIVVSHIIGEKWDRETGYGLSVGKLCGNEYPILVVNFAAQEVYSYSESGAHLGSCSFGEYLSMNEDELQRFRDPSYEG